jgi:uncharacterized protein YggE
VTGDRPGDGRTGVTVTGRGRAAGVPDVVHLALGSEATAASVGDALDAATRAQHGMRTALLSGGVAERDLSTSDTALYADRGSHGSGPMRFTARLGLGAVVRDPARAGTRVQAALAAGGQAARLRGLSFSHSDPSALAAAARDAAFADARARAEQYAALAGQALGPVLEVVEGDGGGYRPMGVGMARTAALEMAVDPGEQDVEAAVTVTWSWA